MKKIYTSILCITLLAPTVARAEICTDFDENFNVIEFDCAEGVEAARKRITAEAKKKQDQERATAEAVASAEREKQAAIEAERLKAELRKAEEQLKKESEKRKALENNVFVPDLRKDGDWKYVVGFGVSGWMGPSVTADAFNGMNINGWTVWNADYDATGISINPSFGLRYYFNQNHKWFAQMNLSVATGYEHYVGINTIQQPIGTGSTPPNATVRTDNFIYIDGMIGRLILDKTYLYGRIGMGSLSYDITDFSNACPDFNTDVTAAIFGLGIEHRVWKMLSAYADISVLTGDFFLGDTFLKFDLGVRYQF